ncbi:ATP synthase F0 subunit B [Lentzea flaviverrucosa]|uniref:HNH endonuclease n=1 Tax=Lentzea flaviverrucosa TaxID=200379 RepID=A0A1H9FAV5_9PSEU|nr:ATP synthase F0 subunit B [Lentzea flaviverrucosa]RDI35252.1 hypothetical protein DFR72_1011003 [Lentzea flaviverrucosa]SEQ35060.1 hypothetical protein SAMN05216195_102214 [Lentzea flaviverrucosa]
MATRDYSPAVRAALTAFSAGKCYWPGCGEQLLRLVNGKYRMALDIAHVCALNPDGPRYDPTMTDKERNDFPNLIYLCRLHHRVVDEDGGDAYSVELLLDWKADRETSGQRSLQAQSPVTVELFETVIVEAMERRDDQIKETLARLAQTDLEAARLLRELQEELAAIRRTGAVVDPDTAAMLSDAAFQLRGLPDSAGMLSEAAEQLVGLPDLVTQLNNAADRLNGLQ